MTRLLDLPNKEVRIGLLKSLLPLYLPHRSIEGKNMVANMYRALRVGNMDMALQHLQQFLATVPYAENTNYEGHYQQLLYVIFSLLGMYVDVEVRTPHGRVDMVLRTADTLYLVELKKNYPERFALCGLPIVKVGINFNREKRTISDWRIEQ